MFLILLLFLQTLYTVGFSDKSSIFLENLHILSDSEIEMIQFVVFPLIPDCFSSNKAHC